MLKTKLLILCSFILAVKSFAQINFERGYFIDLNNQKTDCFIRNYEWKNNPVEFEYKLAEGDAPQKANVSGIKEFGIMDLSKYLGADIKIDRSTDDLNALTYEKNPIWLNERQFLKVLIEGKASLLSYTDGNLRRYFYQVHDTIKQLVYKKYLGENGESMTNNTFRQQLWVDVRCGNTVERVLKQLNYNVSDLVRYFKSHNECAGGEIIDYRERKNRVFFHMKITPGINYSSLSVTDFWNAPWNAINVDFNDLNFRIGLEAEFILPYNRNKWSIILEPTYQPFSSTTEFKNETLTAAYNAFELPLGIRYYSFLSQKSRIFIDGFIVSDFPMDHTIDLGDMVFDANFAQTFGFGVGLGFSYNKISAEIRYYKNGDVLNEYLYWDGDYSRLSFILGYRLF